MKAARCLMLAASSFLAANCGDDAGPTGPAAPVPLIAGTWMGTAKSGNSAACSARVEIEQPNGAREITGSIEARCARASFYGQLVEGMPWRIVGTAQTGSSYTYPYITYTASLRGSVDGSPASRMSVTTGACPNHGRRGGDAMELDLKKSTR